MLDVVDMNGNPAGETVSRDIAHAEGVPHRTSHVWLVRMKEDRLQILLQKRSEDKDSYPGCCDISSDGAIRLRSKCLFATAADAEKTLKTTTDKPTSRSGGAW